LNSFQKLFESWFFVFEGLRLIGKCFFSWEKCEKMRKEVG